MPWWAWVIVILAVLWILGYMMGPQRGKAVTKRDEQILQRRAVSKITSPMAQGDIAAVAGGIVVTARGNHEEGMPEVVALATAFEAMDRFERAQGDPAGLGGPFLLMVGGHLMGVGVLNYVEPADMKERWPSFGPEVLPDDPGAMVRLVGVRDLYAWPPR